jgi:hypothetical protein
MDIKVKSHSSILEDENSLLREQESIQKSIIDIIGRKNDKIKGFGKNLANEIKQLLQEKDLEEKLFKSEEIRHSLKLKAQTLDRAAYKIALEFDRRFRAGIGYLDVRNDRLREALMLVLKQGDAVYNLNKLVEKSKQITQDVLNQETLMQNMFSKSPLLRMMGFQRAEKSIRFITNVLNSFGSSIGKGAALGTTFLRVVSFWAVPLAIALYLSKQIFEVFKKLDEEAFNARKQMGMMRDTHVGLRRQAELIYKTYADLGVLVEQVYKAQRAISLELGSSASSTKELTSYVSIISSQFGIAEDTTVRMLKVMGQMNKTTAESQINLAGFVSKLSNAAGVPLPQVMEDIAKSSETTRIMFAKTPLDMIKAAVEARRLGTTLDKMVDSSRKVLNFTESMENEMETSVLLGRPINLQLVRQLSLAGKIVEANKEIVRLAKMIDFEKLDPWSAESFAKAVGKSGDEIRSMLQASREQNDRMRVANELAAQGDITLKRQLDTVEALNKANKEMADQIGKNYNLSLKQEANQARLTSITQQWKKLMIEISYTFLPMIDFALKEITKLAQKWLPIISIAMKLATLSLNFGKNFGEAFTDVAVDIIKVLKETYSQYLAFFKVLKYPFEMVWDWLKTTFLGNSPSQLGLLMVKGIESVSTGLFDAITSPFKKAWDWISGLFNNKIIQPSIQTPAINSKNASVEVPLNEIVNDNEIKSYRELGNNKGKTEKSNSKTSYTMDMSELVSEIKGLREDFRTGKISAVVYLDSQLLKTSLDRNTLFLGTYGAMQP